MYESSKSIHAKIRDSRYATRYLVGDGVDIGSGPDCIDQYREFFPLMRSCRAWDLPDGDAQFMEGIADASLDFVHSAHCLEHLHDVSAALDNWIRILKPNGHLICIVPDEDLYEQGVFPSRFNADHKHTFTIHKRSSWSPKSINVFDLIARVGFPVEVKKIELLDATYRYRLAEALGAQRFDQTQTPVGECAIEFVLRRRG